MSISILFEEISQFSVEKDQKLAKITICLLLTETQLPTCEI